MPKQRDILGSQNNPIGDFTGGFLASATETFNSVTGVINGDSDSLDDLLGFGEGSESPIYRSSQLAHRTFGLNGSDSLTNTPYLGFQYYVRINYNGALKQFIDTFFAKDASQGHSGFVKSVTMPSIGVESEILNEYNRKRISQSKLKFDPVDIVFHDIINGNTLKIWQMYYQYYFADGRYTKSEQTRNAPINPEKINFEDFGYDIAQVGDLRYLYKSIEIFQLSGGGFQKGGGQYNKVTLHNPRIVDFKHDTMAYSSNDLVELSYTFDYEYAEYEFILKNSNSQKQRTANEADIYAFLKGGNPLDFAEWYTTPDAVGNEPYPEDIAGNIAQVVDTVQAGIDTIDAAKGFARNVAGRVQSISAFGNQIQKDMFGVDEPPFPLPDVRRFTSKIDSIPTNFPDLRRVRKGGG
jgi:hypothetical protein